MPANRNALVRYKTIDKCLRNRGRKWTLENLIDEVSEALYEYEGIDKGISKRTVQADIQFMRSDKLGYNAPIVVKERKYYTYEDPEYSITNIPLSDQDLSQLGDAVDFLKQFHGFSHFRELDGMVQKLEDHVFSQKEKRPPLIHFDKNEHLKGIEFLDDLYKAILNKQVLSVSYKSFKARTSGEITFHPYLLKEYNNRWFIIGRRDKSEQLLTLALDRIESFKTFKGEKYINHTTFHPDEYYKDVVGVTVNQGDKVQEIELFVHKTNAPYVITKPIHSSQEVLSTDENGIHIKLRVKVNFELQREILGYGESIRVIKPEWLKQRIIKRLKDGLENYSDS